MTTKAYFGSLSILFIAMIGGQLIFAAVAYYLNLDGPVSPDPEIANILLYVVPIAALGAIGSSGIVFNNILGQIKDEDSLLSKTNQYRSAFIVKLAMHEGVGLFALVGYFLTANMVFLGIAAIIILIQFTMRPRPERAIEQMKLKGEHKSILQDEDGIIS
ncbi:MAG: hypothetical protein MRZ79_13195 [Bacteroidia bacterium]|nr:hypothetical protein [Bacteroidia bacterium]